MKEINFPRLLFRISFLFYFCFLLIPNTLFFVPEFFLLTSFLFFLWDQKIDWEIWIRDPLLFWFLVFVGWLTATSLLDGFFLTGNYWSWFGSNFIIGMLALFKSLVIKVLIGIFIVVHTLISGNKFDRRFIKFLLYLVFLKLLFFGYLDYVLNRGWSTGRHFTAFAHYNLTGTLLNIFIPLVLFEAYRSRIFYGKLLWSFLGILGINAVYMTQSRGSITALCFSMFVLVFLLLTQKLKRNELIACCIIALLVLTSIYFNPARKFTQQRMEMTKFKSLNTTGSPVSGLSGRIREIWPKTISLLKERPIIGYYLDSYPSIMKQKFGNNMGFDPSHPHNFYLQLGYEGGVVGVILFFVFTYQFYRRVINSLIHSDFFINYSTVAAISFAGEVLIHGLVAMFDYYWFLLLLPWLYNPTEHSDMNLRRSN